ncbi:hypothetical protein [Helicobacter ailurogastricus]|nr:hypothetical protein [Helicobacter ailurogastricus]
MDSNPQTLNNANDQAIIQNYQNIFNTLKSIDGNLQQQIDQYNNKLTTDKDAYESQVNSVIKNNQQAQITYAQNQSTYTDQVTAYDRTTQELSHNLSTCIDSPDCLALPSTYSPTQVQQALNQMMQNTDSIVNSSMPWFFDGPYKNDTSKVITQSQWSQAVQEGNVRASHCQSVSCMHNFDAKFQEVLGPIGYSGISASQVTRVSAWFHQIGEELVDFGSPTQAIRAIIKVYNSFIMQSTMIASYSFSPPSTRSVFGPPPALHKEPMPTPPTLGLTYRNLIAEIQNAQAKIGQQGKITPLQGTISVAPLTRTINSLSRPFANINWNANLGVGVQYFFVNHLGG